ncbi:MAG: hypothetical protein R3F59_29530 [Myxococcota bacterium]
MNVADSTGATLSDADVHMVPDGSVEEYPCTGSGDGAYECSLPDPGTYKLYVTPVIPTQPPYYETYGTTLEVPEPESCDGPALTHDAVVRFESGGA